MLSLLYHCDFKFRNFSLTFNQGIDKWASFCVQTILQEASIMQPYEIFSSSCLSLSPCFHHSSSLQGIPDDQVDLRREIAFNLSLIYQASGNVEMARQLINTHCVV